MALMKRRKSSQDRSGIQETSATSDSQPRNKNSPLKRPHPENDFGETIIISKKKKFKPAWTCFLKNENKICRSLQVIIHYVFFVMTVIFSVFNYVICFIDFIENILLGNVSLNKENWKCKVHQFMHFFYH